MYNNAFAGIEINNIGREIVVPLYSVQKYTNLYRIDSTPEKTKKMVENGTYGFYSVTGTKRKAVNNARYYLNTRKRGSEKKPCVTIRSQSLLRQMDSFIGHKAKGNNTTWARENESVYDDLVDGFWMALSGLHHDYIQTYFVLEQMDGDYFDSQNKPFKIKKQKGHLEVSKMKNTLNQPKHQTFVYDGNSLFDNTSYTVPASEWDFLNNF